MIILDTNVVSEFMRASPDPRVMAWTGSIHWTRLFTTTITQAEILSGVAQLPKGRRRSLLEAEATSVFEEDLAGRILSFDSQAAIRYADLAAMRRAGGLGVPPFDIQIAAIAQSVGAAVATRDGSDFDGCGLEVIDPWA